jgi:RES domain-containing protein
MRACSRGLRRLWEGVREPVHGYRRPQWRLGVSCHLILLIRRWGRGRWRPCWGAWNTVCFPDMPVFYRIVQSHWAENALDGEGARKYGGRWNSAGLPAVYLAESRALAALEILVHAPREALRLEWRVMEVDVPVEWIEEMKKPPVGWRDQPVSDSARNVGNAWLRSVSSLALRVPSVIVPEEGALLLNPLHPKMAAIRSSGAKVFGFDPRLVFL